MAAREDGRTSRFTVVMVALILAAGFLYIVWTTATYQSFVREKALAEARTLSVEVQAAWDYVNDIQPRINYDSDGAYDFKGVYCTAAGKSIARKFNARTNGYAIEYARSDPRSYTDEPDEFERRAIASFEAGESKADEYWAISADGHGGSALRYAVALRVEYACLSCHGEVEGDKDELGYLKEGMRLRDLAGVASITIPLDSYAIEARIRVWQALAFVGVLAIVVTLIMRAAMRGLVVRPLEGEVQALVGESRAKTDFLDVVSHELKTPLSSILAYTDVWEERERMRSQGIRPEGGLEDDAHVVSSIRESGIQLLNMVNNSIDASKAESGRLTFSETVTDPVDVMQSVAESVSPLAAKRNVMVKCQVDPEVPLVSTDPQALRKILTNYVENAVKWSPEGGEVLVEAMVVHGCVRMSVVDAGPGVPEADRDAVFKRFEQTMSPSATGGRRPEGSGLGLHVAKVMAQGIGACVWCDGNEHGGATFVVELPEGASVRDDSGRDDAP